MAQAPDVNRLRLSREEALLGNYSKAAELHTDILKSTKRYMAGVGDPRREAKWKQVCAGSCRKIRMIASSRVQVVMALGEELELMQQITEELSHFSHPPGTNSGGGRRGGRERDPVAKNTPLRAQANPKFMTNARAQDEVRLAIRFMDATLHH